MWRHTESQRGETWTSRYGRPDLPLTCCFFIVWQEQCWDGVWGKGCECWGNVSGSVRACIQSIADRVVCCRSCHCSSQPVLIIIKHCSQKQNTGLHGPMQPLLEPSTPSAEFQFFFPGRWAIFTDGEHQGLLILKHEGSCHLHLPHVLLLCILGFQRNCVWRKLHGGKNVPTEDKAISKLPTRHSNLHKFLSEGDCIPCTRHNSNLLIFSRVCNCRSD